MTKRWLPIEARVTTAPEASQIGLKSEIGLAAKILPAMVYNWVNTVGVIQSTLTAAFLTCLPANQWSIFMTSLKTFVFESVKWKNLLTLDKKRNGQSCYCMYSCFEHNQSFFVRMGIFQLVYSQPSIIALPSVPNFPMHIWRWCNYGYSSKT